ncbi:MAG: hypothetical protein DI544_11075 [Sphingomonas taxi]|uniref:HTH lysR-type domain-containing protein n=1 Tax=Sphingomonas taxi TaxID=1549858 RepID=A0A2W5P1H2_9SPHN|nr:MAG: hypothetical protein DI544_11075 [Sphingomonas taxi]
MSIERYRGLDLNLFVVFDALLRLGSVSKAARSLGRSQSAISHGLTRLREYFGDDLFIKTHDGVQPTQRALDLTDAVTRFVAHANEALLQNAAFDPRSSTRQITLALNDVGELATVPPLLRTLQTEAPGCSVHVVEAWGDDLDVGLASGAIDVAVSGPLNTSANVLQQKLYDHGYRVMVASDCPIDDRITLEQFAAMQHVAAAPSRSYRFTIDDVFERQGFQRRSIVTTVHALTIPHIVRLDPNYVAVVPKRMGDTFAATFGVKTLVPDFDMPRLEVFQYFHRRVKTDPFNMWLRSIVYATFNRHADLHVAG